MHIPNTFTLRRRLIFIALQFLINKFAATVHSANAGQPLEVFRFLRDEIQSQFIQFIPIVERDNPNGYQEGCRWATFTKLC